jgi:hypothetical protein
VSPFFGVILTPRYVPVVSTKVVPDGEELTAFWILFDGDSVTVAAMAL